MKRLRFKIQTPPEEGCVVREADGIKQIGYVTKVSPVFDEPNMYVVTIEVDDAHAEQVAAGANSDVSMSSETA